MSAPKDVTWAMDDHTRAKHVILRKYLDAWYPIILNTSSSVLLIDGFAGPGEYEGGESGSPIIMLNGLLQHSYLRLPGKHIRFVFVEENQARCDNLRHLVAEMNLRQPFPPTLRYNIYNHSFDDAMIGLLSAVEDGSLRTDATFSFIDPFGFSHTPMSIVRRLMDLPKGEVLITFMYEEINRFLEADYKTKAQQYDGLFGTAAWRQVVIDQPDAHERQIRLHNLYRDQLKIVAGAKYVRSFRMLNKHNSTDYFLFFATKHLKGMEAMKRAMWKVDPTGTYQFSDFTNPYQMLLLDQPDYTLLQTMLSDKFSGRTVSLQSIEEFVIGETPFLAFKDKALRPMELAGKLEVQLLDPFARREKGTFSEEKVRGIRFLASLF